MNPFPSAIERVNKYLDVHVQTENVSVDDTVNRLLPS